MYDMDDWKTRWDTLMNDPRFRKRLSGTRGDYNLKTCRRITHPKGTLYLPLSEDEGHFYAYEYIGTKVVRVFDPAHPTKSRYGGLLDRALVSRLTGGRRVVMCRAHPQWHEEDTFCATWTLAWLCGGDLRAQCLQSQERPCVSEN